MRKSLTVSLLGLKFLRAILAVWCCPVGLDAQGHLTRLPLTSFERFGCIGAMSKFAIFALALVFALAPVAVMAQQTQVQRGVRVPSPGNPIPPAQSLQPTPSACSPGSQSLRICSNDFQSCSSVSTATALECRCRGLQHALLQPVQGLSQYQRLLRKQCELLLSRTIRILCRSPRSPRADP